MPAHLPVQGSPKSAWFGTIWYHSYQCLKLCQTGPNHASGYSACGPNETATLDEGQQDVSIQQQPHGPNEHPL